ncbi:MAG: AAA family ATPase [Synechococcus sp. SB0668_bin_15]|nr:AAA family ATPase [Synechococcus sp. SB0668_bin_15]MYC49123.1 AAA family ATPase [Synechococcus sp. SB0662_bin_14]
MLTKLKARNFKCFEDLEIALGNPVVLIGPNNSGKTTVLQALALWTIGLQRWQEKRSERQSQARKRPGVTINRQDLLTIPHPQANLLWRDLQTRFTSRSSDDKQETQNIRIELIVSGVDNGGAWECGLEFDYANPESFYCRPLRLDQDGQKRMPVPEQAAWVHVAFLPPMSGLAAIETRLDPGALNVRIGEGRTAEVLRNLCYIVCQKQSEQWKELTSQIDKLFGVQLREPHYLEERGEITMKYQQEHSRREGKARKGKALELDLSSSGRGLQQTLLILVYMYANPGAVVLLDEPDAHLEILRQRQIYTCIKELAEKSDSQIMIASHSEVLLNEAATGQDQIIACVGHPHVLAQGKRNEVLKALAFLGFEDYYQAEQTGWVLYLEGSTDLRILQAFAKRLGHTDAKQALARPFVKYVGNTLKEARRHYYGLREASPSLRGIALFDRLEEDNDILPNEAGDSSQATLQVLMWQRNEIENYFCRRETLRAYANPTVKDQTEPQQLTIQTVSQQAAMDDAIGEITNALQSLGKGSPWDAGIEASDDVLVPIFKAYSRRLGIYNAMGKKDLYKLVDHIPSVAAIEPEVSNKLDAIAAVAEAAQSGSTA